MATVGNEKEIEISFKIISYKIIILLGHKVGFLAVTYGIPEIDKQILKNSEEAEPDYFVDMVPVLKKRPSVPVEQESQQKKNEEAKWSMFSKLFIPSQTVHDNNASSVG